MLETVQVDSVAIFSKAQKMRYLKQKEGLYLPDDNNAGGLKTGKEQNTYSLYTAKRQRRILPSSASSAQNTPKPVFTIMPDFGCAYGRRKDTDESAGVGGNHAD